MNWLAFLILLVVLVFWRAGLYATRELREGVGRVAPSVLLVAALSLAFAIGTGQRFTTFGLYVVGAVFVSILIAVFRASYELVTGLTLHAIGRRRRALLVGPPEARNHLRNSLGTSRGGIAYEFAGRSGRIRRSRGRAPTTSVLDEILIAADTGVEPDTRPCSRSSRRPTAVACA